MLRKLQLTNFRNYSQRTFEFDENTTLIVGPNAAGKTNILEAIYLLATGKNFRAEDEHELIKESQQVSRIVGQLENNELEIAWDARQRLIKHYKINGVGKRQMDFVGHLRAVLFGPQDLEIATDSPATRRKYLDLVLTQIYKDYRLAAHIYERALRQRNRLLWHIREHGASREQLSYWDELLIRNGQIIHQRRKDFLNYLSDLGDLRLDYDHSVISAERLAKYATEEVAAAMTLVGPHRDNFTIKIKNKNIKSYGSRGEQRLAVFGIKMGELAYIEEVTGEKPILLLDDIFSELDHANRRHVLEVIPKQQTVITTTDLHLVDQRLLKGALVLEL